MAIVSVSCGLCLDLTTGPAQSVPCTISEEQLPDKSTALQLQQVFRDSLLRQSAAVACGQPIEMLANGHCIELLLAARSQPAGVL